MSIGSAKAFVEKVKSDGEFAKKIKGCKDAEERMAFAKQAGFDFTTDEIKEVSSTLSDSELDAVAGGKSVWCLVVSE